MQNLAQNILIQNMVRTLLANTLNNMLINNPGLMQATAPEYHPPPPPMLPGPHEETIHACRDFMKNRSTSFHSSHLWPFWRCSNERCKFAHVPNMEDLEGSIFDPITPCTDFLRSTCDKPRCRFAHILNWKALEARRREPPRGVLWSLLVSALSSALVSI